MGYPKVYWAYWIILVLFVREEKCFANISTNSTAELLFAKKPHANRSKMIPRLPIKHQTTKTKSLRILSASMATLILAQNNNQPTILQH